MIFKVCLYFLDDGADGDDDCVATCLIAAGSSYFILFVVCCVYQNPCSIAITIFGKEGAGCFHYENTPIQIYRKCHLKKTEKFQIKPLIFFIILLKT